MTLYLLSPLISASVTTTKKFSDLSRSPGEVDRAEDFFVVATEADIKGLNRYKVAT